MALDTPEENQKRINKPRCRFKSIVHAQETTVIEEERKGRGLHLIGG